MGKKGKRSGFGGSGGGGNARGGGSGTARPPPGLVVVNPMLLQSMTGKSRASSATAPPAKRTKTKTKTTPPPPLAVKNNKKQTPSKKRKQRDREEEDEEDEEEPAAKKPHPQQQNVTTKPMPRGSDVDADASVAPLFQLQLAREDQCLAGLYWVLLTRDQKRSAVVAVPNAHATLTPPMLAHALKSLGFQALSLHSKMTPGQRKHNVERLAEQARVGNDKCVLVVNDHWLGTAGCGSADLVAFGASFAGKGTVDTKFVRVFVVHADVTVPARAENYEKPLSSNPAALQQLQARLKIATQIATTLQRLQSSAKGGGDVGDGAEAKWATKFAKGADLSDDDDEPTAKKKRKGPLNPDEQRMRALTEKLLVLLGRALPVDSSASNGAAHAGGSSTDDAHHRVEKLKVLGVVVLSAAVGASAGDGGRLSAQTQWLDRAPGARFGAEWSGVVRHGASKDATSLAVRRYVCECLGKTNTKTTAKHLSAWRPNQLPADVDAWGGAYGKVCGHNEVAMQHLRPFFPQEVLNSRVCSKRQPAPGNQGFDGCLEFLRLACLDAQRCMTLWDAEQFVFLSKSGRVGTVSKLQLLALPLAGLQTLMVNMRQWTIACEGRMSPVLLLEGIRLCCKLGAEDVTSTKLPDAKLVRRVLAFAVGGSQRVWKQIAKMPAPIASEVVYDAA